MHAPLLSYPEEVTISGTIKAPVLQPSFDLVRTTFLIAVVPWLANKCVASAGAMVQESASNT